MLYLYILSFYCKGITFKKAALIRSVTVNCLRKKVVVASLTGIV